MAEAFVVIGLAANIAQFLGYGIQLISGGKEIYYSLHGARDKDRELEIVIEDIKNLSDEVIQTIPQPGVCTRPPSSDERAIRQLGEECKPLADKLLRILNDLKVSKDARFRGLEAVWQTFRNAGKRKDIEELRHRLLDIGLRLKAGASNMLHK
jgi:hypothetical protein